MSLLGLLGRVVAEEHELFGRFLVPSLVGSAVITESETST